MPPTAEVSVARWNRDSCHNDVALSHSTVPNHRDTGRHGYFQSPYVRGAAEANRNPAVDSPRTGPSRQSTGCVLPNIDSHRNKLRPVHSGSPPASPATSGASRRRRGTVPPANTSSSPRDVTTDGSGQFPTVACRDSASVSGGRQADCDDDWTLRDNEAESDSRVLPVSPPRSILALHRCHDCSMENIRTFTNGVEQDIRASCPQQRIGRRISRLMPSAAATTVLRDLSLSPRTLMAGIDDNTIDQSALASGRPSTGRGCALSWEDDRKRVRFEPNVRVFCDETSSTEIHPLRSATGNLPGKSTTCDVDLLFPPLHSTETVSMFSEWTGGDVPAVVKRYMVRSSNQQQQQQ